MPGSRLRTSASATRIATGRLPAVAQPATTRLSRMAVISSSVRPNMASRCGWAGAWSIYPRKYVARQSGVSTPAIAPTLVQHHRDGAGAGAL